MFICFRFGETVNIANKMESHGEPLRIHGSTDFKLLLDGFGSFTTELRGEVEVKVCFQNEQCLMYRPTRFSD